MQKKMAAKINTINDLQQKINTLKNDCRQMEGQLEARMKHLQKNYAGMAANSLLDSLLKAPGNLGMLKNIFAGMWQFKGVKGWLKNSLFKFLQALAVRLGFKIVEDFATGAKKKTKPKDTEEPFEADPTA